MLKELRPGSCVGLVSISPPDFAGRGSLHFRVATGCC